MSQRVVGLKAITFVLAPPSLRVHGFLLWFLSFMLSWCPWVAAGGHQLAALLVLEASSNKMLK